MLACFDDENEKKKKRRRKEEEEEEKKKKKKNQRDMRGVAKETEKTNSVSVAVSRTALAGDEDEPKKREREVKKAHLCPLPQEASERGRKGKKNIAEKPFLAALLFQVAT